MTAAWRTIHDFVRIGTTGKPRGIHGELRLYLDDAFVDDAINSAFLFLERDGNKVPFEIESIRQIQDVLVKFKNIDNPTSASQWTSATVFLPSDELTLNETPTNFPQLEYDHVTGFTIVDMQLGVLGTIVEVREFPQQEMAVIDIQDREVLIPLNAVFIIRIDDENRVVQMDLPAGILEI